MRPFSLFAVMTLVALLIGCGDEPDPPVGIPAQIDTRSKVKLIIARHFNVPEHQFTLEDPLMADKLGADQLDLVELVMALEDHFQVVLPDAVLVGSKSDLEFQPGLTGQQIADLVEAELRKK